MDALNVIELPGLVESGLFRSVESEHQEKILAGGDPVCLLSIGRGRGEVDVDWTVVIHSHFLELPARPTDTFGVPNESLGRHAVGDY